MPFIPRLANSLVTTAQYDTSTAAATEVTAAQIIHTNVRGESPAWLLGPYISSLGEGRTLHLAWVQRFFWVPHQPVRDPNVAHHSKYVYYNSRD